MNVAHWLHQTALAWPDKAALYDGASPFATYRQFAQRTCAVAKWMADQGVKADDRIAILCANCPEYLEIMHAAWWLGASVVPINYKLHTKEAAWIIENSGAVLTFTQTGEVLTGTELRSREIQTAGAEYNAAVASPEPIFAPCPRMGDETAWIFYTSGTTGRPKGVMLTHDNLVHTSLCYGLDVDQPASDQFYLYAAPMSHGAGLYALVFVRAAACHLVTRSRGFDPDEIIELAAKPGNLCLFAAPTMVKRLIDQAEVRNYNGDGIRTIVYGGGPMYAADIDRALAQFGPRFVQIYGQGESPMTITALSRDLIADTSHPNWRLRRDSVGVAHSCMEVRVVDHNMRPVRVGDVGDIVVRGATVMKGYWNDPDATSSTIVDGWLLTGDLGRLDPDGFLTLTDRSKDVIISGGSNIYPREVEEVLLRHPSVAETAVIGTPDREWGESVVAFVVVKLGKSCTSNELEAWCRTEIASFKKPKRYVFLSELPKNAYGKILKTSLRVLDLSDAVT